MTITGSKWPVAYTNRDRALLDFPDILYDLEIGQRPAIVVRGFYSKEYCREVVSRLSAMSGTAITTFSYPKFDGTSIAVNNVGPFLMQYIADPTAYFSEARRADATFAELFKGIPDVRQDVRSFITTLMEGKQAVTASENGIPYSSSVIRVHGDGEGAPLHRDRALADAQGWMVSQFQTQFSAVLSLQKPTAGGELVMYRRLWSPGDDASKPKGTLGYSEALVDDAVGSVVNSEEGDLYILNPGFFHEIRPSFGQRLRLTLGVFFAVSQDDPRMVFWS